MQDEPKPMRPIVILPKGVMDAADIAKLEENGICVVEAQDPAVVRFLDPIPAMTGRTAIEDAAIQLSRKVLSRNFWSDGNAGDHTRAQMARAYVDILVRGTALDPNPTKAELERQVFDEAKRIELIRLAQEEAREDRRAARESRKAAQAKAQQTEDKK